MEKDIITVIREMEKDFGFVPSNLDDVNLNDYYEWLISGYNPSNHYAETPDF